MLKFSIITDWITQNASNVVTTSTSSQSNLRNCVVQAMGRYPRPEAFTEKGGFAEDATVNFATTYVNVIFTISQFSDIVPQNDSVNFGSGSASDMRSYFIQNKALNNSRPDALVLIYLLFGMC